MTKRRPGDPVRGAGPRGTRGGEGRGGNRRPANRGAAPGRGLAGSPSAPDDARPRSRFTGRAAVLVLVLLVLMMSYASSMKAYLQQRSHIDSLNAQIVQQERRIEVLTRETQRWEDPAYVRTQARQRFGYVLPGETSFVVVGADGEPLEPKGNLSDPADVVQQPPTAWWDRAWASVELAGNPPRTQAPPAQTIRGQTTRGSAG